MNTLLHSAALFSGPNTVPKFPDRAGTVKLFVGTIPAAITVDDLSALFASFGTVHECHILKKGQGLNNTRCAFVRLDAAGAQAAILLLHNKFVMVPNTAPIVVRYADSDQVQTHDQVAHQRFAQQQQQQQQIQLHLQLQQQQLQQQQQQQQQLQQANPFLGMTSLASRQRTTAKPAQIPLKTPTPTHNAVPGEVKLFVGTLPPFTSQADLYSWFAPFGHLIEAFVFRRVPSATGNRCGFVRFSDRNSAEMAVQRMHGAVVEGGTTPIVVRYADSEKCKYDHSSLSSLGGYGSLQQHPHQMANVSTLGGGMLDAYGNSVGISVGCLPVSVLVSPIPMEYTQAQLEHLFSQFDGYVAAGFLQRLSADEARCGILKFATVEDAEFATHVINGRPPYDGADPLTAVIVPESPSVEPLPSTLQHRLAEIVDQHLASAPATPEPYLEVDPQQWQQHQLLDMQDVQLQMQQQQGDVAAVGVSDADNLDVIQQILAAQLAQLTQQNAATAATMSASPDLCEALSMNPPDHLVDDWACLEEAYADAGPDYARSPSDPTLSQGTAKGTGSYPAALRALLSSLSNTGLSSRRPSDSALQSYDPKPVEQVVPIVHTSLNQAEPQLVKLFVGSLPGNVDKDMLAALFLPFGSFVDAFVFRSVGRNGTRCGFVRFWDLGSAQRAIATLHQRILPGSTEPMVVRLANNSGGGRNGQPSRIAQPVF